MGQVSVEDRGIFTAEQRATFAEQDAAIVAAWRAEHGIPDMDDPAVRAAIFASWTVEDALAFQAAMRRSMREATASRERFMARFAAADWDRNSLFDDPEGDDDDA